MKVTVELEDYSNPAKTHVRVHSDWRDGDYVEIEIAGDRHVVSGEELISAVKRCMINELGRQNK